MSAGEFLQLFDPRSAVIDSPERIDRIRLASSILHDQFIHTVAVDVIQIILPIYQLIR